MSDDQITSIAGPVEKNDEGLVLRIPLSRGGDALRKNARGISQVRDGYLEVQIPRWLVEKLRIEEGDIVDVDNADGKFNIAPRRW